MVRKRERLDYRDKADEVIRLHDAGVHGSEQFAKVIQFMF